VSEFILFTRDGCKWCDEAKSLLLRQGHTYQEFRVINNPDIVGAFGFKTVPQVFHGTKYIGGFTDLRTYIEKKDFS
jgi:glutaredoxin